jgi:hypothetical protein
MHTGRGKKSLEHGGIDREEKSAEDIQFDEVQTEMPRTHAHTRVSSRPASSTQPSHRGTCPATDFVFGLTTKTARWTAARTALTILAGACSPSAAESSTSTRLSSSRSRLATRRARAPCVCAVEPTKSSSHKKSGSNIKTGTSRTVQAAPVHDELYWRAERISLEAHYILVRRRATTKLRYPRPVARRQGRLDNG